MRVLAISDIHGNVEAVRQLRRRESNNYHAIVVAGDIGAHAAAAIMDILASFTCPVMYVYGNWDRQLAYDMEFGPSCHHLHLRSVECGGWSFAGMSGLAASWGLNPIAATLRREVERKYRSTSAKDPAFRSAIRMADRQALQLNKAALVKVVKNSSAGPGRTVLVAHDRLFGIDRDLPGLRLHLFGHRHGFKMTARNGTTFINVSAMDDPINGGRYSVIEDDGDRIAAHPFTL